jgi:hypothetical protein
MPNARPVQDPDGGTAYILYRKDRVKCSRGAALLKSHLPLQMRIRTKLKPENHDAPSDVPARLKEEFSNEILRLG